MFKGLRNDEIPVLYKIYNLREDGFNYFKLDNEDYSIYPHEQEVLLVTGETFLIIEIIE